jgi:hypothetical protein
MKQVKRSVAVAVVLGACVLTGVAAGAKGPAKGSQFRESITVQGVLGGSSLEHHLTFSGPVALPGVSLGPGTYIFSRPANSVLLVTNSRRQPYAMLSTMSASRTSPSDHYEVILGAPLTDGSPRRIEAWFVPGESNGPQLIYSAAR